MEAKDYITREVCRMAADLVDAFDREGGDDFAYVEMTIKWPTNPYDPYVREPVKISIEAVWEQGEFKHKITTKTETL